MSGIFGVLNRDGGPLPPGILNTMLQPMVHWGPDGQEIWEDGHIGFGHLALLSTPESLHEQLPMGSLCGNYVITANARIDNRQELLKLFDIPSPRHPLTSDSWLILEAYKKWGEECPNHLLGDWAFAIWDKKKQKLFIARDHHGNTGLYYYQSGGLFFFSSCVKGILTLPGAGRALNEMYLARRLVSWAEHGRATVYSNIFRLPPAHEMTVSREHIQVRQYWYLEHVRPLRLQSDDDYVEALLEILNEAVRCRLRSIKPIGISLSGGLDSNSVATLAARELWQKGIRLKAFSSVPYYPVTNDPEKRTFGDEKPYIESSVRHIAHIDVTYVRAGDISPLEAVRHALSLHDEPVHASGNQFWLWAIREEARKQGIGVLLTGQGGNGTISWHGRTYLAKLAATMRWSALWKELRAWKLQRNSSWKQEILTQIVNPLLPLSLKNRIYDYRQGGEEPWLEYSAINPDFARRIDLSDHMREAGHNPAFSMGRNPWQARNAIIKPGANSLGCRSQQNAAPLGIELRDPTNDKRVLEYCLAIPDNQYFRDGQDRHLIRRAMKDYLPPEVRLNDKHGLQGADIGERLYDSRDDLKSALKEIQRSALAREFLDLKRMNTVLHQMEQQINTQTVTLARTILLRGLMAGIFLSNFEKSQ